MSLKDQAAVFAGCSVAAGEFTSALHNTIFSPAGTAVVAINRVGPIQWRIASACGHYLDYVIPNEGIVEWEEEKRAMFTVNPSLFEKALTAAIRFSDNIN